MSLTLITAAATIGLFFGILIFVEIGRRIGISRQARDPDGLKGVGAAEGAIFGLLGLIIAFTFSGAAARFEDRRHLITEEVNDIGTAYLRIDLLPGAAQPELRELFRRYVDSRFATYQNVNDAEGVADNVNQSIALQQQIWTKALAASREPDAASAAPMLLVPALNAMIDIATTRLVATRNHPPLVVFLLLPGLSLIGALLFGCDISANKSHNWVYTIAFATALALVSYVVIDLEFPRLGLIRIDAADQLFIELRSGMR